MVHRVLAISSENGRDWKGRVSPTAVVQPDIVFRLGVPAQDYVGVGSHLCLDHDDFRFDLSIQWPRLEDNGSSVLAVRIGSTEGVYKMA